MKTRSWKVYRGFPGFVYFRLQGQRRDFQRLALLQRARKIYAQFKNSQSESAVGLANDFVSSRSSVLRGNSKVLLFKNIFNSPDNKQNNGFCSGTLYLASGLKKAGFDVIFVNAKISLDRKKIITDKIELENILLKVPEIKVIGISLCEGFFEQICELIEFIRTRTKAFIGVGGVMPTLTPEHVFAHLPGCNFLVRGAGENVLPQLVRILADKDVDSAFTQEELVSFSGFKGLLFHSRHLFFSSGLNIINSPLKYDDSSLDFSFLNKEDVSAGLPLFTSRGCHNACSFCTSPGRGQLIAKSFSNFKKIIRDYRKRLNELFADEIPVSAFRLCFYDDDFLADPQRARDILRYLSSQHFRVDFFQTGINSFFERKKQKYSCDFNSELTGSITPDIFLKGKRENIYIGTENFSDDELRRLCKGYGFSKVEKVVSVLSEQKIYQSHHLILSNHSTTISDLLDNLLKISILQSIYGEYFNILTPIIPYLVSFYPSISHGKIVSAGGGRVLNVRRKLSVKGYPGYDYPLVNNDIPTDAVVRKMVPVIQDLFLKHSDYSRVLDEVFCVLLFLREKFPSSKQKISQALKKYSNYPEVILRESGRKVCPDRNNLQLMITRRCQLDCDYCPIIKKDIDMDEETLFRAIDMVFTSSREDIRLDFTGGEPLLRFDLVKKGVEYAKIQAFKKRKSVSFYMVTNLIALTDEIADFIAGEDFFLELSVDGEEGFHNRYKLSKNKELNPYRVTISGLKKIFSRKIDNYAVMVVGPATAKYVYKNFRHLLKLGFRNIGINYALCSFWKEAPRRDFFRQTDKIIKNLFPYIKSGNIRLSNFGSRSEPAVLNNEVLVNCDGKVHFLTDWLFEKTTGSRIPALGRIDDFGSLNEVTLPKSLNLLRMMDYHNQRQREIILNNIEMGIIADNFFKSWKKRLNL